MLRRRREHRLPRLRKKLANRHPPQVPSSSVILLLYWEVPASGSNSSETAVGPMYGPADFVELAASSTYGGCEGSPATPIALGSGTVLADGVVDTDSWRMRGETNYIYVNMKPPLGPRSRGSSSLSEEDIDGPFVPKEMEVALRESSKRSRDLGHALRRLGQAIQPGMEVMLKSSICTPSSPEP